MLPSIFIQQLLNSVPPDNATDNFTDPIIYPNETLTECREVHNVTADDRCQWVTDNPDCDVESFINYASFMFCAFSPNEQSVALIMSIVWMLILFIALGVAATDFLCPALFLISKTLNMSQNVAGVTLIAFGNGSPDIFAAIAGMMSGRPALVIGGLLGGATFVMFAVIGTIFTVKSFKLMPKPFLRDIIFYVAASTWIFYLFIGPRAITIHDAVGFLLFYALYVVLVICSRFWDKNHSKDSSPGIGHGHGAPKAKEADPNAVHEIVFEGITPDEDPLAGMVVMKGFMFLGDDLSSDKPPPGRQGQRSKGPSHNRNGSLIKANEKYRYDKFNNKRSSTDANNIPAIKVVSGSFSDDEQSQGQPDAKEDLVYDTLTSGIQQKNQSILKNGKFKVSNYDRNLQTITSVSQNDMTVTSGKSVSIFGHDDLDNGDDVEYNLTVNDGDDGRNSVYNTITSIFQLTDAQRSAVRRASKDFLEKITPIDMDGWKHKEWGGRSFEVIKAPIRLFLLLTTPMAEVENNHRWNKPLSVIHCITGPLFVVYATGLGTKMIGGVLPLPVLVFIIAALISCGIIFTSKFETAPRYYKIYSAYLGFVIAVAWVYFICTEVVSVIRIIGIAFNLSEPTIGMTLLAWGNCLLDFISNVSIAKKGFPRMAVGACLGSPLLALLIGVGIPATITLAQSPASVINLHPDNLIVVIYIALTSCLLFIVFSTGIFKFVVKRPVGFILITSYACLMVIIGCVEWKLIPVHFI